MVAGQTVLRPGTNQLLPLMTEELHQVYFAGPELLFLGKMDIGHLFYLLGTDAFVYNFVMIFSQNLQAFSPNL